MHVIAVIYFCLAAGSGSGSASRRLTPSCASLLPGSSFTPTNPEGAGMVIVDWRVLVVIERVLVDDGMVIVDV